MFSKEQSGSYFKNRLGTSLAVQWLGLCASTAGVMGSIPGRRTKISEAARRSQKKKKKEEEEEQERTVVGQRQKQCGDYVNIWGEKW